MKRCEKYIIVIFLLLLGIGHSMAQASFASISISERHIKKLDKIKSPSKKLAHYRKFYSKDSIRMIRDLDKYWKRKSDSLTRATVTARKNLQSKKSKAIQAIQVATTRVDLPSGLVAKYSDKELESILTCLKEYIVESKQDTNAFAFIKLPTSPVALSQYSKKLHLLSRPKVPDLQGIAKDKIGENNAVGQVKQITDDIKGNAAEIEKYKAYTDMTPDSLRRVGMGRLEEAAQQRIMAKTDLAAYQQQMGQLNEIKALQAQYKGQLENMTDSAKAKEMARKKAEEIALKYMQQNTKAIQAMEQRMASLMKKYSVVPNSNDLSTAVKASSLKGKVFRERLVVATNFQVVSLDPIVIDFSPQLGYRFNTLFATGLGFSYRHTFKDSIPVLSPNVMGFKAFATHDIVKSFFAYAEYSRNSPGVAVVEGVSRRIWKPAALIGVGRRFSIHKKLDMTTVVLYNFLWKPGDPVYPRRFVARVGFQLSDKALFKKPAPQLKY